uniref:Uncharacterized protein n=1 Tax=Caenorhabditis tropicalis TaxID=1561998 RepID=A0A1I7TWH5_9PELO
MTLFSDVIYDKMNCTECGSCQQLIKQSGYLNQISETGFVLTSTLIISVLVLVTTVIRRIKSSSSSTPETIMIVLCFLHFFIMNFIMGYLSQNHGMSTIGIMYQLWKDEQLCGDISNLPAFFGFFCTLGEYFCSLIATVLSIILSCVSLIERNNQEHGGDDKSITMRNIEHSYLLSTF